MAYLKGGSYVDGDLYIDGTIKVKNIDIIGGNSTVTLASGVASVKKHSLLRFAVGEDDPLAGAVEYSKIYVEEEVNSNKKILVLSFGQVADNVEEIVEVKLDRNVDELVIREKTLYLDPSTRTWSYNVPT